MAIVAPESWPQPAGLARKKVWLSGHSLASALFAPLSFVYAHSMARPTIGIQEIRVGPEAVCRLAQKCPWR